jgi:hypothetical protein
MKRALLTSLLVGAVVYAPPPLHFAYAENLDKVHSVVVDMPQTISLSHASPETWNTLPASVQPDELPPAIGQGQQLAMRFNTFGVLNQFARERDKSWENH